jgi:DNA mismatch endonuclease (patch repair protein)
MTDVLNPRQRSFNMSRIRGKDTSPEIVVRRLLHSLGYRFRLHVPDLPGRPDIVLPKYRAIIFVHGCFWHMHRCKYGKVVPKTNEAFWQAKRASNVERDRRHRQLLRGKWLVLIVWECETRNPERLRGKLDKFFGGLTAS